ncbi:MHC class I polypeptide-related sequence B-like [Tupaia chinensis]|uniref:MHC class I polypeptide-related sequence B-like n=1 Tax=Tupaia chinensis TaxID=246437 RepID=UPI000FFBDD18|nr:MHC class I polypeptide-related sequence B-like [Tupaia chinensis]
MRALEVRPALPFLVGIGFFVLEAAAGPHTLQYTLTVGSQDTYVQSRFYGEVFLNGQHFLHYDSENDRAEPGETCAEAVLGAETRNAESKLVKEKGQDLRTTVARIDNLHKRGLHSFQETWGCEIQEDGSTRGFRDFRYDGEPLLSYDLKTQQWTVPRRSAQALAVSLQRSLDEDAAEARKHYDYVQRDCVKNLEQYLRSCMDFQKPGTDPGQGPVLHYTGVSSPQTLAKGTFPMLTVVKGNPLSEQNLEQKQKQKKHKKSNEKQKKLKQKKQKRKKQKQKQKQYQKKQSQKQK